MKLRTWCAGALLVLGSAVTLGSCDDDDLDEIFDTTDVVGRMLLPDLSPASGATCEIFFENLSYGIDLAAADGFFEFDDWPERLEPILVRGTYVQPGTGTIFMGASPLVGTNSEGDTDLGDIVLSPVPGAAFTGAPAEIEASGIAVSDPDGDGRLDVILLDSGTGVPRAVIPGR